MARKVETCGALVMMNAKVWPEMRLAQKSQLYETYSGRGRAAQFDKVRGVTAALPDVLPRVINMTEHNPSIMLF